MQASKIFRWAAVVLISGSVAAQITNPGFESGSQGWKLGQNCVVEKNSGRNATGALYVKQTDKSQRNCWASQTFALEPGRAYRISCYTKAQITATGAYKMGASFILNFRKGGKVLSRIYQGGLWKSNASWTRISREFTMPADADRCTLQIGLYPGFLGEAYFDDVHVEPLDRYFVHITAPGNRMLFVDEPVLHISALRTGGELPGGTFAKVTLKGGSFNAEAQTGLKNNQGTVKFKSPIPGLVRAHLQLFSPDGKKVLAEDEFQLNICEKPQKGSYIDTHRRLIVDGKPFMPVGFYVGYVSKEELKLISDGGFNCVIPYSSMSWRFGYGQRNNPAAKEKTLEVFDFCHENNIKVIFSMANVYEKVNYAINKWYGVEGADKVMEAAVNTFKDHPALLGWYIGDEFPVARSKELARRRNRLNEVDPHHVSFAVSMYFNELYYFAGASDVGGVDPYPIAAGCRDMYAVQNAASQSARLNMPFWGVPQIFNQAYYSYNKSMDKETLWNKYHRDPSEEEIRSMCFRMAQYGCRGFIFYYWVCLRDPQKKSPDPNYFETHFPKMKKISAVLNELAPYLMSVKEIRNIPVNVQSGQIMATEHTGDNGKSCILITAQGPGASRGSFKADKKYRSRFGKTVYRDGKYIFTGKDISSDLLMEE